MRTLFLKLVRFVALGAAVTLLPASASADPTTFAVWLDGNTTPGGGGQGILTLIDNTFGSGHYTLVTSAQLATPGFLNSFSSVVVSRFDSGFGTPLSAAASANVSAYVGAPGPTQGGVALFTNDASDNLFGSSSGDVFDANINRLFANALTFAAASGHGYIGEFNGAVMGMSSTTCGGYTPLGLLPGSSDCVHGFGPQFTYDVGPIGAGNPIDNGVTFPFTDGDTSTFLTDILGADPNNIVDIYTSAQINGEPAVLANQFVISGGGGTPVPEPASLSLLAIGLTALAVVRRRKKH